MTRGGSRAAAASKMDHFVIIVKASSVNYYHKALYLGCCSSPRSDSGVEMMLTKNRSVTKLKFTFSKSTIETRKK